MTKESQKRAYERYAKSEKGKKARAETLLRYRKTEEGRAKHNASSRASQARRRLAIGSQSQRDIAPIALDSQDHAPVIGNVDQPTIVVVEELHGKVGDAFAID